MRNGIKLSNVEKCLGSGLAGFPSEINLRIFLKVEITPLRS
jgi:hypothetical protein